MKIRRRLITTLVAVTVPLLGGLSWFHYQSGRRVMASELTSLALSVAAARTCPLPVPRHPRARFYVYDAALQADASDAPPFPRDLYTRLDEHERAPHALIGGEPFAELGENEIATRTIDGGAQVLVRLRPGSPKCAFLVAHEQRPPRAFGTLREIASQLSAPAAVTSVILIILWVSLSGVVTRLRRLTEAVASLAARGHEGHIEQFGSDEIGTLANAFNAASSAVRAHLAALNARDQTLREFLANTTHDVMMPLTVMQGALSQDPPDVQSARMQAYYIGSLLSNLSAAAKLEGGTVPIQRSHIALDALVERAVERYRGIAIERGIELDLALPGEVLIVDADPTLTEQCIGNLIYNAVRYNRRGGQVTVVLNERGGRFLLRVIDDGPGMSEEERRLATLRGFRGQGARRDHAQGMGLGLAIAQAVTERHSWVLTLDQSSSGGLEARVEGPVAGGSSGAGAPGLPSDHCKMGE